LIELRLYSPLDTMCLCFEVGLNDTITIDDSACDEDEANSTNATESRSANSELANLI